MRLLKLIRFFRFLPCFSSEGEDEEAEPTMSAVRKVSAELSAVLSRRVAALVMIVVLIVPFLDYPTVNESVDAWVTNFKITAKNETATYYDLQHVAYKFRRFYENDDLSPISVLIESPYAATFSDRYPQAYQVRDDNMVDYKSNFYVENIKYKVRVQMNRTIIQQWDAFYGIILIILVIVVLVGFSASFNNSVDVLVVVPLEKMMNTLRKSATAMLRSMQAMDKEDELAEELGGEEELETAVLEKMVEKLARIVKHVTNDNDLVVDENVDKATASWLTENYASNVKKKSDLKTVKENAGENADGDRQQQLMKQHSSVNPSDVNSWQFDVLKYTHEELFEIVRYIFDVFNLFEEFRVPIPVFNAFLQELSVRYLATNSYHNFFHAVDVMHTSYRLIMVSHIGLIATELEVFSMLVAALGHDVGHPGVNNAFLVKTRHELAMIHNDKSPLENMHCSLLYEMFSKEQFNIVVSMDDSQWRDVRKIILALILGTDMAHHFDQVSKTQLFLEVNGDDVKRFCAGQQETIECFGEDKNRLFVMEVFLHCSDISNPFKPFDICAKWADLVSQEFFAQGDKERGNNMDVSPMMDRDSSNLFNMQMGFIEFVVSPLVNTVITLFPPLHEMGSMMLNNYSCWGEKRKEEIRAGTVDSYEKREEDAGKVEERITKFKEKMSFLANLIELKRKHSNSSLLSKRSG